MRVSLGFLKPYRGDLVPKLNPVLYCVKSCHGELPSDENNEKQKRECRKWGYFSQGDHIGKQDKDATGLYHLNTIHLPPQLEKNLNNYLRKFPGKALANDAFQLSKHLQNRGRPTERTWSKYKEAKTARKMQENVDMKATQDLDRLELDEDSTIPHSLTENETADKDQIHANFKSKSTKKPKIQDYKVVRYKERETAAYAAGRIPASYGTTLRVLHEISKREKEFKPATMLDFGSGLGTATWAAHELWKDSIKIYQCIDISKDMNEAAQYLLRGSEDYRIPHYIPRMYFKEYLPVSDKVTYDIVVASYSLSEIPFRKTRKAVLENLWRKTNHFLVIVEVGNNEGFDITMEARDMVAENKIDEQDTDVVSEVGEELNEVEKESCLGYVFSPCPHDLQCPRSDINTRDHPCNFEQRVQLSSAQRRTSLKQYGYYNEMFSYLVLRKAKRNEDELNWPRLLRPVRLRKKHVVCNFCSKNGSLQHKILTKRKDSEIYKCVRHRTKWGDLLPPDVENASKETTCKEPGYELDKETICKEPGYEVAKETTCKEPGYELGKETTCKEPGYELGKETTCKEPGYELGKETTCKEPGYELGKETTCKEPGYELGKETTCKEPGYELGKETTCKEPGYELGKETTCKEPGYEVAKENETT